MAEIEKSYASKGVAGTALGIGIGALGLEVLRGGVGNILNGNCETKNGCNEDHLVDRYELGLVNQSMAKDGEIALLKSNIYTDQKISDAYERLAGRINLEVGKQAEINTEQAVYNATNTAGISCLKGQVHDLNRAFDRLTEVVVPSSHVCDREPKVIVANTQCDPVYTYEVKSTGNSK